MRNCKIADKGNRLGNFIIDILIILVVYFLIALIITFFSFANFEFLFYIIFLSYYIILEYFFGKTIGKMSTKTIVLDIKNNKPSFWKIVIRTIFRIIPFDPFTFLFGNERGLHDIVSRTKVVQK